MIPKNITNVIFLAGVNNLIECEKFYKKTYNLNCINVPALIKIFLKSKIKVLFVSTNSIFGKTDLVRDEKALPHPDIRRGKMALITEKKILNYSKKYSCKNFLTILRVTKNIDYNTEPFNHWIRRINDNKSIFAFKDLYFAPIRFIDTCRAIYKIINSHYSGIFHLSGEKDINYINFAKLLLKHKPKKKFLLKEAFSYEKNVNLVFNDKKTLLNMKRTTKLLKLNSIKLNRIVSYFNKRIK